MPLKPIPFWIDWFRSLYLSVDSERLDSSVDQPWLSQHLSEHSDLQVHVQFYCSWNQQKDNFRIRRNFSFRPRQSFINGFNILISYCMAAGVTEEWNRLILFADSWKRKPEFHHMESENWTFGTDNSIKCQFNHFRIKWTYSAKQMESHLLARYKYKSIQFLFFRGTKTNFFYLFQFAPTITPSARPRRRWLVWAIHWTIHRKPQTCVNTNLRHRMELKSRSLSTQC